MAFKQLCSKLVDKLFRIVTDSLRRKTCNGHTLSGQLNLPGLMNQLVRWYKMVVYIFHSLILNLVQLDSVQSDNIESFRDDLPFCLWCVPYMLKALGSMSRKFKFHCKNRDNINMAHKVWHHLTHNVRVIFLLQQSWSVQKCYPYFALTLPGVSWCVTNSSSKVEAGKQLPEPLNK